MAEKDFNIKDVQIIVPMKRRGHACTYVLNNAIQELFNPDKGQHSRKVYANGTLYNLRVGDKIINTSNIYNLETPVYNGNMGIIKDIDYYYDDEKEEEYEGILIDFFELGEIILPKKYWNGIELAYAITGHKFQGSSCDTVIVGLDFSSFSLLTKEWVYTSITRPSRRLYLLVQTNALRMATSKEGVSQKQTHLQQCLHDVAHPKLVF